MVIDINLAYNIMRKISINNLTINQAREIIKIFAPENGAKE